MLYMHKFRIMLSNGDLELMKWIENILLSALWNILYYVYHILAGREVHGLLTELWFAHSTILPICREWWWMIWRTLWSFLGDVR